TINNEDILLEDERIKNIIKSCNRVRLKKGLRRQRKLNAIKTENKELENETETEFEDDEKSPGSVILRNLNDTNGPSLSPNRNLNYKKIEKLDKNNVKN